LPEVLSSSHVLLVEGEKDADALVALGLRATTSPMGADNWKPEYAEFLRGKHVAVIPDNDGPGKKYAEKVLKDLHGVAASVRVVKVPVGKDVSDWIQAGASKENILALIDETPEWEPSPAEPLGKSVDIAYCLQSPPAPYPFLFQDRIPFGRGCLVAGLGGSSKTRLMYHLAIGSIIGTLPFPWKVNRTGKAILVLTEDVADDVHRVLYSMISSLQLTNDDIQKIVENLVIHPLAGRDTKLLIKTPTGIITKAPLFHETVEYISKLGGVVFIGLDPAIGLSEGDELDQLHQRELGKAVDDMAIQTGATCAIVAHATKASINATELSSHNARGAGALTDAVRAEYSMRNMTREEASKAGITDIEERKRHIQLVATKGNMLPPSAYVPVWLRRDESGNLVFADIDLETDPNGTPTDNDLKILSVHGDLDRFCIPNIGDWRAKCIELGLIRGATDQAKIQAMKRVCDRLKAAGLIKKGIGKGVWIRTEHDKD
jgi:5S rRNA maturation endonuclease (ribonuclease M5)